MSPGDPDAHLRTDEALAPLVARYGPVTVEPASDPFARLIESICSQQVSTAAADSIQQSLFETVEITPEGVVAADAETLEAAGLSSQKRRYVRAVAQRFHDWDRATFADATDEAVRARLTDITGVGPWTADMFLFSRNSSTY